MSWNVENEALGIMDIPKLAITIVNQPETISIET